MRPFLLPIVLNGSGAGMSVYAAVKYEGLAALAFAGLAGVSILCCITVLINFHYYRNL